MCRETLALGNFSLVCNGQFIGAFHLNPPERKRKREETTAPAAVEVNRLNLGVFTTPKRD
jgi:hypothetical protein